MKLDKKCHLGAFSNLLKPISSTEIEDHGTISHGFGVIQTYGSVRLININLAVMCTLYYAHYTVLHTICPFDAHLVLRRSYIECHSHLLPPLQFQLSDLHCQYVHTCMYMYYSLAHTR